MPFDLITVKKKELQWPSLVGQFMLEKLNTVIFTSFKKIP